MPGQGLARADNYNPTPNAAEYGWLMDMYGGQLPKALATEQSMGPQFAQARTDTLDAALNGLNGQPGLESTYLSAVRGGDPQSAALSDTLATAATNDLALDNRLDPNQQHAMEQNVRTGQAARGMGYGNTDVFQEMMMKSGYGDQLRQQRRGFADLIQQQRQSLAATPANMATQTSTATNPNLMDPQNMWRMLAQTYGENQQNNRQTAELETKIGMDQANKWNDWLKMAAGAMA